MRTSLISLLFVVVLASCNTDNLDLEQSKSRNDLHSTKSGPENCLVFATIKEYNNVLDSLRLLSDEELKKWELKHAGFRSMYSIHSSALEELLSSRSEVEYNQVKAKYKSQFIFNEINPNDLSIYMPVADPYKAITLNSEGHVLIGEQLVNMNEFSDFKSYNKKMQEEYPTSKATIENGVNRIYVKTKKKKFKAQIGKNGNQQAIRVNASKKFLWGWIEYTTAYYWRFTPTGPVQFGKEVKSGNNIYINGNPFPNGTRLYMWSRGVGEENRAIMTIQL